MTGGGPVQEPEQSWSVGAGANRRPWSRAGQQEQLNSQQHSSESWNNSHQINMTNHNRDEILPTHNTLITLISANPKNPRKLPNSNYENRQQHQNLYNNKLEDAFSQQPKTNNDNNCDFNPPIAIARGTRRNEFHTNDNNYETVSERQDLQEEEDEDEDDDDFDDDDESLSETLSAVASAEEYAAKISKLQQACLTPLKEDLADWLNKIMNLSTITSDNFMNNLDNGVIICRMAKIISMWCEQQFSNQQLISSHQEFAGLSQYPAISENSTKSPTIPSEVSYSSTAATHAQNYPKKLSTSISNVHSQLNINSSTRNNESSDHNFRESTTSSNTPTPITQIYRPQPRARVFTSHSSQLKSTSSSTNCIPSLSTNSLKYLSSTNPFLDNLIKMIQTKIWEDAKCRTFYARDNVSNFLRWTRGFGVNQSVLFESDDLVLHANTRQVVLCLLDVARIACVKHGFTEAPGLVKFEQEIDRELAAERDAAESEAFGCSAFSENDDSRDKLATKSAGSRTSNHHGNNNRKLSSRDQSASDELILRYCKHKEEEAARKKTEAAAVVVAAAAEPPNEDDIKSSHGGQAATLFDPDSLLGSPDDKDSGTGTTTKSPVGELQAKSSTHLGYDYRVDSLDSGEGRTESASTSHSRTPVNNSLHTKGQSAIPVPIKQQAQRSESNFSLDRASSVATSELSSSRSSLLSNQDSGTASNKRHLASSDLDGKVMRIAKSYYGKGAKRGVTRLSEGKYKIADRIVFVRLLKGHRVMVRIGGGWDTLENFLFRHKSDPSQVIDVDNLLPLETKMTFEKGSSSVATTPAGGLHKPNSKLPYYQQRKSSSASSTNLSASIDLSVVSPTINSVAGSVTTTVASTISTSLAICTPVRRINNRQESMPESVPSSAGARVNQTPYLLIHRGNNLPLQQNNSHLSKYSATSHRSTSVQSSSSISGGQPKTSQLRKLYGDHIGNKPLGSSKTPTASSTNLYPATLTTNRMVSSRASFDQQSRKPMNGSANNLNNGTNSSNSRMSNSKRDAFRKLGRSNDSLQVSFLRTPRNYGNSSTTNNNGSQSHNNAMIGAQKSAPKSLVR